METVYLDTHVVAWLYMGQTQHMSRPALDRVDRCDPLISPIVLLELEYLFEAGKIKVAGRDVFKRLELDLGLKMCSKPFDRVISESFRHRWTRDPFDRLITAYASVEKTALITRDETIRRHYDRAVW